LDGRGFEPAKQLGAHTLSANIFRDPQEADEQPRPVDESVDAADPLAGVVHGEDGDRLKSTRPDRRNAVLPQALLEERRVFAGRVLMDGERESLHSIALCQRQSNSAMKPKSICTCWWQ